MQPFPGYSSHKQYLLPSVTQQQHVMEYWWEGSASTAIPPTSASDAVGQHNKIEGIILEQLSYNYFNLY